MSAFQGRVGITNYLAHVFEPRSRQDRVDHSAGHVRVIADLLERTGNAHRVTHVVSTGLSGGVFASILAYELDLGLGILRKRGVPNHGSHAFELSLTPERFTGCKPAAVFVDDLVDTGATANRVREACEAAALPLLGQVLYAGHHDTGIYLDCPVWDQTPEVAAMRRHIYGGIMSITAAANIGM